MLMQAIQYIFFKIHVNRMKGTLLYLINGTVSDSLVFSFSKNGMT